MQNGEIFKNDIACLECIYLTNKLKYLWFISNIEILHYFLQFISDYFVQNTYWKCWLSKETTTYILEFGETKKLPLSFKAYLRLKHF